MILSCYLYLKFNTEKVEGNISKLALAQSRLESLKNQKEPKVKAEELEDATNEVKKLVEEGIKLKTEHDMACSRYKAAQLVSLIIINQLIFLFCN
jgi:HAMP domain-containing protein